MIYKVNLKIVFKHGFNLAKLDHEIRLNNHINKPLINITNDRRHPYILLLSFDGILNIREIAEFNLVLKNHVYGPQTPSNRRNNISKTYNYHKTLIDSKNQKTDKFVLPIKGDLDNNFIRPGGVDSVSGIYVTLEDIILYSENNAIYLDGNTGVNIGNAASNAPVNIATSSNSRDINIGNTTTGTNIAIRYGGSLSYTQYNEIVLPTDSTINIDFGMIISGILYGTPISDTDIVLPSAQEIVFSGDNIQQNDGYDFSIVNLSSTFSYTLTNDPSITVIGSLIIDPNSSGFYRIKVTNTTFGSETCTLFKLS
jgi:hypothetical protein